MTINNPTAGEREALIAFLRFLPAGVTDEGQEVPLLHMLPESAHEYLADALLHRNVGAVSVEDVASWDVRAVGTDGSFIEGMNIGGTWTAAGVMPGGVVKIRAHFKDGSATRWIDAPSADSDLTQRADRDGIKAIFSDLALFPSPSPSVVTTVENVGEVEVVLYVMPDLQLALRDSDQRTWIVWGDTEGDIWATSPRAEDDHADFNPLMASLGDIAFPATVLTPTTPPPSEVRVTGEQVEAALALHKPVNTFYRTYPNERVDQVVCSHCGDGDPSWEGRERPASNTHAVAWPCPTAQALGVPVAGEVDRG